jgi:uncharacterized protein (TIGR03435 family)
MFVCVSVVISFGQAPAPAFDVAAIRPANPDSRNGTLVSLTLGGGLRVVNATLKDLIETGYQVRSFQILGGPQWAAVTKYDVAATSALLPEGTTDARQPRPGNNEVRLKVQAFLKDRFQLQVHRETRNVPIYSLIVAKNGIKAGGLNASNNLAKGINASQGSMLGEAASMANLAAKLSNQLDRPVENNTGLEGKYDFKLQWTPELGPPTADGRIVDGSFGPSLFTALQEQLGLRLESTRGPVEVLIIDQAERPSEN